MEQQDSVGGRVAVWAQWVLLVAYLLGSLGVLLFAVAQTGDAGALLDPGLERLGDPKDSLPDSVWNPLAWLLGISRVVAMLVVVVAPVALLLGLVAVAGSRRVGDRKVFRWSLAGTAAWLLVLVVALTPYGRQMTTWLLD
ncbi:hypothetical protein AB0F81_41615 [Actinoplanes sp. NPDC024001]|uniref:hypothetical protein n=1 Tax=Actinoplanes sp. NPDC024001 TaxID=3154598 RepID=UPI0033FD3583